jgi:hypothetical protein
MARRTSIYQSDKPEFRELCAFLMGAGAMGLLISALWFGCVLYISYTSVIYSVLLIIFARLAMRYGIK